MVDLMGKEPRSKRVARASLGTNVLSLLFVQQLFGGLTPHKGKDGLPDRAAKKKRLAGNAIGGRVSNCLKLIV